MYFFKTTGPVYNKNKRNSVALNFLRSFNDQLFLAKSDEMYSRIETKAADTDLIAEDGRRTAEGGPSTNANKILRITPRHTMHEIYRERVHHIDWQFK